MIVCDCCPPTVTLPKDSVVELSPSCPPEVTPVPAKAMFVSWLPSLLVTAAAPLNGPDAFGVNRTVICVLCPAAIVSGRLGAVRTKYFVDTAALLRVSAEVPEFVALTVIVLLVPIATLPKFRIDVPTDKLIVCCVLVGPAELNPWHPTKRQRQKIARNALAFVLSRVVDLSRMSFVVMTGVQDGAPFAVHDNCVCAVGAAPDECAASGPVGEDFQGT